MRRFEFSHRFLQPAQSGVCIVRVVRFDWPIATSAQRRQCVSFCSELQQQSLQLLALRYRKISCRPKPLLDLRDGVFDHDNTVSSSAGSVNPRKFLFGKP